MAHRCHLLKLQVMKMHASSHFKKQFCASVRCTLAQHIAFVS